MVLASTLENAILCGELGGNMCFGFDLTNSPAQVEARTDVHRPMVLVSSSGTQLILNAAETAGAVYLACLRNYSAVARHLAGLHDRIAVIGAGTRGQFRREDQFGCALVARALMDLGYRAENDETIAYVERWRDEPLDVIREGRSADYLRRSDQLADLEFVLSHIDDVETVPLLAANGELVNAVVELVGQRVRRAGSSWRSA
jgi:2-phosphosulfolactate phosphatase